MQIVEGWTRGILGGGGMPAVQKGGVRTIRVPPELAFGERGDGCAFGLADSCQVPPNTPVEITFKYLGFKY
jgi:peptidylprolyl isomerase